LATSHEANSDMMTLLCARHVSGFVGAPVHPSPAEGRCATRRFLTSYLWLLALWSSRSRRNCFGHDADGAAHMPSVRTKAQMFGIWFFAQMSGFV